MACGTALGLGLSCLSAHPLERSDAGSNRRLFVVQRGLPALGASVPARGPERADRAQSRYALRGGNDVAEGLDQLRAILGARSIEEVIAGGLHEFIDFIQRYLIAITIRLSTGFFAHEPEPEGAEQGYLGFPAVAYSSQMQT